MTTLQTALQNSGAVAATKTRTNYERLWEYIKEHPAQTRNELALALRWTPDTTGFTLNMLQKAKLIRKQAGSRMGRATTEYVCLTNAFVWDGPPSRSVTKPITVTVVKSTPVVSTAGEPDLRALVDSLTVAKLRALRNLINEVLR